MALARNAATGSASTPSLLAQAREQRAHVGLERLEQEPVRAEHVAVALRRGDRVLVDEQRLGVRRLDVHHRLDHRVDLALDVVRLVDHERDRAGRLGGRGIGLRERDLAHDPEELEGVDRADDQVVVGVLAVVEVEAAEQSLGEQERDDLLDVRALRVVAGVDEHLGLRPEPAADERGRAPVGQVGAVEAPARRTCTRRAGACRAAARA